MVAYLFSAIKVVLSLGEPVAVEDPGGGLAPGLLVEAQEADAHGGVKAQTAEDICLCDQ
jgi:hypothetical protein